MVPISIFLFLILARVSQSTSYLNSTRNLQAFSTLNNIISEITLVLPDSETSSNGLDITITDLICYEINIQDVQVTRSSLSGTNDRLAIDVIGLTVTCNFRWSYEWTILSVVNGRGIGKAMIDSSSTAALNLNIKSGSHPPRNVSVNGCMANVQIGNFDLDGDGLGAIASIINLFKKLLMGMIEKEVNAAVCLQINELGDGALLFTVQSIEENIVTYALDVHDANSSGAGWLVLLIILIIAYSVSCCFCGIFCADKVRNYLSSEEPADKDNKAKQSILDKTEQEIEGKPTPLKHSESTDLDTEGQIFTDITEGSSNTVSETLL